MNRREFLLGAVAGTMPAAKGFHLATSGAKSRKLQAQMHACFSHGDLVKYPRPMRSIATDTADFPKLRESGCIYVDKTMYMHRLVSSVGTNLFFISRPRRFGKSLTVSALKALFSARRELFNGL